ncbi:MAG: addiction module protein, partial [Pyrinomonadaceae bacterium]
MNTQVAEIFELSVAETLQIVEAIWDGIGNTPEELSLSEAEKSELDKRLESY